MRETPAKSNRNFSTKRDSGTESNGRKARPIPHVNKKDTEKQRGDTAVKLKKKKAKLAVFIGNMIGLRQVICCFIAS